MLENSFYLYVILANWLILWNRFVSTIKHPAPRIVQSIMVSFPCWKVRAEMKIRLGKKFKVNVFIYKTIDRDAHECASTWCMLNLFNFTWLFHVSVSRQFHYVCLNCCVLVSHCCRCVCDVVDSLAVYLCPQQHLQCLTVHSPNRDFHLDLPT